jgi:ATP-dependent Clp protease protease subunit
MTASAETSAEKSLEIYATLAGRIDEAIVQRVFNQMASAISGGVKSLHLMIQSTGGIINDGIALYNYLRRLPIDITTYNSGTVQSIAVSIFLAAKKRKASRSATFMIHKATFYASSPTTSFQLSAATQSLKVDDDRIERILKEYIRMPEEKWDAHRFVDLFITAEEALQFGLIDEIADFAPPPGATLINI